MESDRHRFEWDENVYAIASGELDRQWRQFGGESGREVAMPDIENLLRADLIVRELERVGPAEFQRVADWMGPGNPLKEFRADEVNMENPAIRAYALRWLRLEHARARAFREFARGDPARQDVLRRNRKDIIACKTAIGVLKNSLRGNIG